MAGGSCRSPGMLADIAQFTGLTHRSDGTPEPGGFPLEAVITRARWLTEAAGDRDSLVERSVLVQATHIGHGADAAADEAATRLGVEREVIDETPFLLFGSVEQVIDRLESLRETIGVSHLVVRDATGFGPVVAAVAGR